MAFPLAHASNGRSSSDPVDRPGVFVLVSSVFPLTREVFGWTFLQKTHFLIEIRATRRKTEPPTEAEIERGLREKAVSDPRAAEILLRRSQRPRRETRTAGVDLDSLSEAQLERLYAGLMRLASLDEPVLAALVEQVSAGEELASSS